MQEGQQQPQPAAGKMLPLNQQWRLRGLSGQITDTDTPLPDIWSSVNAAASKDKKRSVVRAWYTQAVVREQRATVPHKPTQDLYNAIIKLELTPQIKNAKMKGFRPAMLMGATQEAIYNENQETHTLQHASTVTPQDIKQANKGRDVSQI